MEERLKTNSIMSLIIACATKPICEIVNATQNISPKCIMVVCGGS